MRAGGNSESGRAADAATAVTASFQQMTILRAVAAVAGIAALDREKPILVIEELRSQEWASATFIGHRHEFDLRIDGPAAAVATALARLVADLADHDINMPGHIVAELAVMPGALACGEGSAVAQALLVEALVIKD